MRTLIGSKEIAKIVAEMAREINRDNKGEELVVIGVLKGSIIFMADLIRKLDMPLDLQFIEVSSYHGTKSGGRVKVKNSISKKIKGKHVLLVEDIIDTGLTLNFLRKLILKRRPKSLKIAAFLDKPSRRKAQVKVDYIGREIPDEFVVGYGLDYNGRYRNLAGVMILEL